MWQAGSNSSRELHSPKHSSLNLDLRIRHLPDTLYSGIKVIDSVAVLFASIFNHCDIARRRCPPREAHGRTYVRPAGRPPFTPRSVVLRCRSTPFTIERTALRVRYGDASDVCGLDFKHELHTVTGSRQSRLAGNRSGIRGQAGRAARVCESFGCASPLVRGRKPETGAGPGPACTRIAARQPGQLEEQSRGRQLTHTAGGRP
jgi:hypothetical protein